MNTFLNCIDFSKIIGEYHFATKLFESLMNY